jgi:hypothetical protein
LDNRKEKAGICTANYADCDLQKFLRSTLISKSRITHLRNGGRHTYVSARRLFWVIRELQAGAGREY